MTATMRTWEESISKHTWNILVQFTICCVHQIFFTNTDQYGIKITITIIADILVVANCILMISWITIQKVNIDDQFWHVLYCQVTTIFTNIGRPISKGIEAAIMLVVNSVQRIIWSYLWRASVLIITIVWCPSFSAVETTLLTSNVFISLYILLSFVRHIGLVCCILCLF